MRASFTCGIVAALLVTSHAAFADDTPAAADAPAVAVPAAAELPRAVIGGRGRVVLDLFGGTRILSAYGPTTFLFGPLTFSSSKEVGSSSTTTTTSFGFTPSADVFVTDRLSLGATMNGSTVASSQRSTPSGVSPAATDSVHGYALGIAPRVGYAVPIVDSLALWPRLSVGYDVVHDKFSPSGRDVTQTFRAALDLGLVLRVSKHVVLDMGPVLAYDQVWKDDISRSASVGTRAALRVDF